MKVLLFVLYLSLMFPNAALSLNKWFPTQRVGVIFLQRRLRPMPMHCDKQTFYDIWRVMAWGCSECSKLWDGREGTVPALEEHRTHHDRMGKSNRFWKSQPPQGLVFREHLLGVIHSFSTFCNLHNKSKG